MFCVVWSVPGDRLPAGCCTPPSTPTPGGHRSPDHAHISCPAVPFLQRGFASRWTAGPPTRNRLTSGLGTPRVDAGHPPSAHPGQNRNGLLHHD
jgi:hypothetical protein